MEGDLTNAEGKKLNFPRLRCKLQKKKSQEEGTRGGKNAQVIIDMMQDNWTHLKEELNGLPSED